MEKNVTSDDKKSRILDLIKEAELKAELEHENGDPLGTAFKLDKLDLRMRRGTEVKGVTKGKPEPSNSSEDDMKPNILDLIEEAELKHKNGDPLGTAFKLDELNRNKRNNKKSRTYSRSTENKKTRKRKSPGRGIG